MKYLPIILFALTSHLLLAQDANQAWKGNKAYEERSYEDAQESYSRSLELSPSTTASYNLANSLYRQKKYEEAGKIYQSVAGQLEDKEDRAQAYHNLGNTYLKTKKIDEGIAAYKQALRNNPTDEDTRYNLSYAMKLKKEQEEEEKKDQDKKDEQKDDQEKNEDQKKDKQDQDKQEQDEKKDQDQDKQDQDQQKEEQQQQPQPNEISKQDAERILENMENEEEKTQEKVRKQKRKSSNVKIENDW